MKPPLSPMRPRVSSPACSWIWRGLFFAGAAGLLWVGRMTVLRSPAPDASPPGPAGMASAARRPGATGAEQKGLVAEDWSSAWVGLVHQPASAWRDIELAALIEELAAVDGEGAIRLANANSDPGTRTMWLNAALRGWAKAAPREAIEWFARLDESVREQTSAGLIAGLIANDAPPRDLLRYLYDRFPSLASAYGSVFFAELARLGRFPDALEAALIAPPGEVPDLLASTFKPWAERQPDQAIRAAALLSDPEQRALALQNVASGWAETAPAAAAAYSERLLSGNWRQTVLLAAAQGWTKTDPQQAVEWLGRLGPEPAFDQGAVQIATMPALLAARPDVALRWALSTENPALRENVVGEVMRYWMTQDPASAQQALGSLTGLDAAARQRVLESLPRFAADAPP